MTVRAPDELMASISDALRSAPSTRRRFSTLVKQTGHINASAKLRRELQRSAMNAGVYPRPKITSEEVKPKTWIDFSPDSYPDVEPVHVFPEEAHLEAFIEKNWRRIDVFRGLTKPQRQQRLTKSARGRVDMLCRERGTRDYVAIELKRDAGGDGLTSQIFGYLEDLKPKADAEGVGVRGIVVTSEPNEKVGHHVRELSEKLGIPVDWYCYVAEVEFHKFV